MSQASNPGKRKRDHKGKGKPKHLAKSKRGAVDDAAIKELEKAIDEFAGAAVSTFAELPISAQTKRGLKKAFYTNPTDVQSKSIPLCLGGRDVHATARTGSGKTLCFLIPLLELLYRRKWGPQDGLGAVVISPTRELAVQTFDVLRNIGGYHSFSAGLVIGGKKFAEESKRVAKMNILIATPGRLLQHLDQVVGFDGDNLQMLVLDEADRILDMGFSRTLNAILSHFPKTATRQTLLFSATSSSSSEAIASLARLSLNNPINLAISSDTHISSQAPEAEGTTVAESSGTTEPTPKQLAQHFTYCPLPAKIDTLYSFIKSHLTSKIITFVSTTKQVRFLFRSLSALTPGTKLFHLHGHQSLTARLSVFDKFKSAQSAVLIATDVASRGLDFPSVDWVVQVDCPEDVDAYIHRVGRTARHEKGGNGLIMLLPSEEKMIERLKDRGIQIEEIKIKQKKVVSIQNKLQLFAFKDPEIKYLAQRTFISYVRSIHLHADKDVFKMEELPLKEFAESLGLAGMPKVKFVNGGASKSKVTRASDETEDSVKQTNQTRTKYDRLFKRKNQNILSAHYNNLIDHKDSDSGSTDSEGEFESGADEEDFITLARADHDLPDDPVEQMESPKPKNPEKKNKSKGDNPLKGILPASATIGPISSTAANSGLSKRALKIGASKKAMLKYKDAPQKFTFDEEGEAHDAYNIQEVDNTIGAQGWKAKGQEYLEGIKEKLEADDQRDREEARERRREKKRLRKEKERLAREGESAPHGEAPTAILATGSEDDGYVSPEFDLPPVDESDEENLSDHRPAKRKKVGEARLHGGGHSKAPHGEISGEELERLAVAALRG